MTEMEPNRPPQVSYHPLTPVETERKITEANDLLEALVEALNGANDARYVAEATYTEKVNGRLDYWMTEGFQATQARAKAKVEAMPEMRDWLGAKRICHELEDLSKAMHARINSLLNINKNLAVQYGSYR